MEENNTQHTGKTDPKGVAGLFRKEELKKYFIRYLILIGSLELFIFFVCFLSQMEPFNIPFPWKEYFVAAFAIPIAMTFVLGIIIIAFNTYYFKDGDESESLFAGDALAEYSPPSMKNKFFKLNWQFQFLTLLFGLGMGAVIFYKLDDIFRLIGYAGERTANILLIILGILLVGLILLGALFLFLQYLLNRKRMEDAYAFKREMVERTGMLLLDNNTLINSEGKVIYIGDPDYRQVVKEIETDTVLLPGCDGVTTLDDKS